MFASGSGQAAAGSRAGSPARLGAERIEPGGEVAEVPVGLDEGHPGGDRPQRLVDRSPSQSP